MAPRKGTSKTPTYLGEAIAAMESNSFIAHWQEWVTLAGYFGLAAFVAWQVFTRS